VRKGAAAKTTGAAIIAPVCNSIADVQRAIAVFRISAGVLLRS
jgi:hypothetical protein